MIYLLDTSMASFIIKGRSPAARARLEELRLHRDHETCVSIITVSEILYGLEKIGASPRRRKATELFFSTLSVYVWDYKAAQAYGVLRATQEALGRTLGPYDIQIAAQALALRATAVTHDNGFHHVPGLPVEDWAMDL